MEKRKRYYIGLLLGAAWLAACSSGESVEAETDTPAVNANELAVGFVTNDHADTWKSPTRATSGIISDLKAAPEGFGVIAYLTETAKWADAKSAAVSSGVTGKEWNTASTFPRPDFMYNQPVMWSEDRNRWAYSPVKYWPNYTNNKLTSDGNTTPAPRYVSFFAYAPFVEGTYFASTGVTGQTWEHDLRPHIIYTVDEQGEPVDLLWAEATDQTRNGQGLIEETTTGDPGEGVTTLTYQKVPLEFKHALSCIDVYVQRVYDEPTYSGKTPADDDNATKLFMHQLTLTATNTAANGLFKSGRLNLEDGSWSGYTNLNDPANPVEAWQAGEVTLSFPATAFVDHLAGTQSGEPEEIRNAELEKWGVSGSGVDEDEELLFKAGSIMLIPQSAEIDITPAISYAMVTRGDPSDLVYSPLTDAAGNHYTRIVNTVQGNDIRLKLEASKRYKLVIRIGVEHVDFIVAGIEDWDFPIRLNPTASGATEEEIGHTLNEE
jgi:hypothetical protein